MALRLAKAGWWGGDPGKILGAPIDEVAAAMQYEHFLGQYEETMIQINKERRGN